VQNEFAQRLRSRLSRRFALHDETIIVAGRAFAFTRVADPEKVLDDVIAAESTGAKGRMPYWAELWESAIGVGAFLLRDSHTCISALDLGCGMGFSGMIAASLGMRVMLADIEQDSLLFAALNTARWRENVRTRRLDWRVDHLGEKFDLIIGADVLYERAQWEHLEPFFREHLAPTGKILLGEPGRPTSAPFPEWISGRGWNNSIDSIRLEDRGKTIRVFTMTP
jgi:predicted nicotinamide N-methyase